MRVSLLPLAMVCALASSALAGETPDLETPDLEALAARLAKLEEALERQQREVRELRAALDAARAKRSAPSAAPSEASVRALLAKRKPTEALAAARARLRLKPGADSRALLAEVLVADGDLVGAHDHLEAALRLDPQHAGATCLLAEVLLARRDFEQARQLLDRLIEADPKAARAWALRGRARLHSRPRPQLAQAIEDLGEAISLEPRLGSTYFDRGVAYYESRRFEDAIRDLERALELGGVAVADTRYVLGCAHYYLEHFTRAIDNWEAFLKEAPKDHRARKRVGDLIARARAKR